jgi:sortase A
MAFPRAQTAGKGGLGLPFRFRLFSKRKIGFAGGLALVIGLVLVVDAVITVVWEDPLTAVFTQQEQKELNKKLAAAEAAPLPPTTLALVKQAGTPQERMAVLAAHTRATTKPGDPLGRLAIPRIGSNFVFVSGTGTETLKKGPGHYADTPLPGEGGTVAIAGHRTTYAAPFRRLDRLRRGDAITLVMPYGWFIYGVEGTRIVSPSNTSVLKPGGHNKLVLTTCTPEFSAKQRIVVNARLMNEVPRGQAYPRLIPIAPKPIDLSR